MNFSGCNTLLIRGIKIGLRAANNSTSCWALIGLAIRIAQNLGIHRDGDGLHLSAHEAEVRRRIWWHIFSLDMKASEDRGCEPMLSESSFNTRLPINLEDDDFDKQSLHPLKERKGITKITLSLMNMEVARTSLKLHFVPPKHTTPVLTYQERDDLANECISKIDSYFVDNYDPTNPYHELAYSLSRMHVLRLRLVVLYPMQRMLTEQENQPRTRALKYVVKLLSIADSLLSSDFVKRFSWHSSTSVSWHPIAVALAELCTEPAGPLADEAWRVIDKRWAMWSHRIPSSQEEKIWRPVKSLLKKAREARQHSQPQIHQLQALSLSEDKAAGSNNAVKNETLVDYNSFATTFDNNMAPDLSGQVNGTFDPYQWDINNGTYPSMDVAAGDTLPMNWDQWNAFIYDAGNLDIDPIDYYG